MSTDRRRTAMHDSLPLAARLEGAIARALSGLPPSMALRLSGDAPLVIDGCTLDPHLQLARAFSNRRRRFGLCEPTVVVARERYRRESRIYGGAPTAVGAVRDLQVPGITGMLAARHYAPQDAGPALPLLVWFHGGGFVIGDLETHDEPCRLLCRDARTHVLSVAYRLAPEHPYPAAVEDAGAAFTWALARAESLGADPARVSVGGDSAGGNLAAVVARRGARDGTPPAGQLLVYPATDSATPRPSRERCGTGFFLTMRDVADFTRHYTGGRDASADPDANPLRATDLHGLPPALVVTAGFDPLRDEGEAYAGALRAAGSPARTLRLPSMVHGFIHMTALSPGARGAMRDVGEAWRALVDAGGSDAPARATAGTPGGTA